VALPVDKYPILQRVSWSLPRDDGVFQFDALGGRTRKEFFEGLAARLAKETPGRQFADLSRGFLESDPDEEFFEWIDLLEAVAGASGHFTIVELGCGWGRWMALAHLALRQINDLPATFVGVEAEPTHFRWTRQHLEDNGVPQANVRLIEAAVGPADGSAEFYVGSPDAWYGQSLVPLWDRRPRQRLARLARRLLRRALRQMDSVAKVRMVSLDTVMRGIGDVDLLDMDIQGAEADVLVAAAGTVDEKVRRVHIGTHSRDNEAKLRSLFGRLGWTKVNDFGCDRWNETPAGRIWFQDGVQTWLNPRLAPGDD
jgi:FkbM family methyltransferase